MEDIRKMIYKLNVQSILLHIAAFVIKNMLVFLMLIKRKDGILDIFDIGYYGVLFLGFNIGLYVIIILNLLFSNIKAHGFKYIILLKFYYLVMLYNQFIKADLNRVVENLDFYILTFQSLRKSIVCF
ncbi:hypothetical protein HERIO_1687 [Hepatospora eriocheir]|uniref:Uncharacterized protein n=1 Tax=Hepatospora eriocheir TaxID=1081669 RepID=A0A1X0Q9B2_9MICR|nr:hypothetical protein HERIO_1687 [Hepatospora eriocheir]